MIDPPKLELRNGIFEFNKDNVFRVPFEEMEDVLYYQLRETKREKTKFDRCLSLMDCFFAKLGDCISMKYFLKCLDHVELTLKEWEVFVKFYTKKFHSNITFNWWYRLKSIK